ncbi:MAG TPA: hypothetical protein VH477_09325 [Bryobacteraceae bacterium]
MMRDLQLLAVLALTVVCSACGLQVKSQSVSADGHHRVILLQQRLLQLGGGLDIRYETDSNLSYATHEIGDVYLNFIEYAWSKDSKRVGFFIAAMPRKGFAFDFEARKEIPFEEMQGLVADKIRTDYGLTISEDPFRCSRCTERFIKEHPSSVTY